MYENEGASGDVDENIGRDTANGVRGTGCGIAKAVNGNPVSDRGRTREGF